LRRYFILTTKKCRIYAAFGVSQTPKNISRRKELYTEEGRQYYKGNLWIPDDLETYKL